VAQGSASTGSRSRGLLVHLQGHILFFGKKPFPSWNASTGFRLLLIVVILEAVRIGAIKWLFPTVPLLVLVPLLLACALLLVRYVAGLNLSQIGFHPWQKWTAPEKSYFIQLLIIANVVFPLIFATRLQTILSHPSAWRIMLNVFVPYFFFGFYQEVVYRGMLQSEVVRRWGALAGVLVSNALYTFGPLHWYYFFPLRVPMFLSIFAIGLFFGILFKRSGNLWMVAIMHGIGNAYIVGSLQGGR